MKLVTPENSREESVVKFLEKKKKEGFLFHGSSNDSIVEFEPRKSNDPTSKWNSQKAVYASSEPVWSTIFAVYQGGQTWSTDDEVKEDKNPSFVTRIPTSFQDEIGRWTGHVYVLPKDGFKQDPTNPIQFRSFDPVQPIDSIKVTINDYYQMGGVIEWT